jgi:hypothetical protein
LIVRGQAGLIDFGNRSLNRISDTRPEACILFQASPIQRRAHLLCGGADATVQRRCTLYTRQIEIREADIDLQIVGMDDLCTDGKHRNTHDCTESLHQKIPLLICVESESSARAACAGLAQGRA